MTVVDTAMDEVTATVPVLPEGTRGYVTGPRDGRLTELDLAG